MQIFFKKVNTTQDFKLFIDKVFGEKITFKDVTFFKRGWAMGVASFFSENSFHKKVSCYEK